MNSPAGITKLAIAFEQPNFSIFFIKLGNAGSEDAVPKVMNISSLMWLINLKILEPQSFRMIPNIIITNKKDVIYKQANSLVNDNSDSGQNFATV